MLTNVTQNSSMGKELEADYEVYDVAFLFVGLLGTSLGILVIVIVLTQSPESMRTYKRFIINFTIFDILFALTLGVLVKPDPLFPFTGAYIEGLFKYLGEQGAIISAMGIVNTAAYAISTQCYCIMYRFAILQANPKYMELLISWQLWTECYLGSFVVNVGTYFIFRGLQPAQKDIPALIIKASAKFPDVPLPQFGGKLFLYFDYSSRSTIYAGLFILIGFLVAETICISSVYLILQQLEGRKATFSKATYKLHRQLTIALGIQLATPILFIVIPVTFGVLMTYLEAPTNITGGRLFILYIDLYSASNSIVTLYFVKPYRMFIIDKFKRMVKFLTCGRYGNVPEGISVIAHEPTLVSALI